MDPDLFEGGHDNPTQSRQQKRDARKQIVRQHLLDGPPSGKAEAVSTNG